MWTVPLLDQGSLQEQEDSEPDSSLSQSPNVQDWLSHARSTRTQQHHDNLLRQRVRDAFYVSHPFKITSKVVDVPKCLHGDIQGATTSSSRTKEAAAVCSQLWRGVT